MLTKEILDSHPIKTLKSEISKHIYQKIKGYSKMKRPELTDLMMEHKDKFMDLKHAEKKEKKAKAPKAKAPKKDTHAMPDGSKMTGKVHSKDSKPVKKKEPTKLIPKKKKEKPKAKAKFIILKEEINDLLEQTKKSYEKNKSKLDKMTPLKYKNTIKKQNIKFLDEAKDIYNSLNYNFDMTSIKEVDKRFYEIIPREKAEKKEAPAKAKGRKKTVKMLTLAKGQGTSTKIGNVVGPDGKSYEPSKAAQLWEARGFTRVELSKADLKKTEKLAIKYGPFGKYGLGNQLESFLKNKF